MSSVDSSASSAADTDKRGLSSPAPASCLLNKLRVEPMPRCAAKVALKRSAVDGVMYECSAASTSVWSLIAEHHARSHRPRAAGSSEKETTNVFFMRVADPSAICRVTASGASAGGVGAIETTLRRSK